MTELRATATPQIDNIYDVKGLCACNFEQFLSSAEVDLRLNLLVDDLAAEGRCNDAIFLHQVAAELDSLRRRVQFLDLEAAGQGRLPL